MKQPSKYKELIEFASKKFFRYFNSYSVTGITHEDIVSQVFEEILTGKRQWYPCEINSFHSFLFLQVLSAMRNFAAGYRKLPEIRIEDDQLKLKYHENLKKMLPEIISQLKNQLNDRCDFAAVSVLASMTHNLLSNKQIAEFTGLSITTVKNARVRMRRKARDIYSKLIT